MRDSAHLALFPQTSVTNELAPCREPALVHANARRMRVHLPHWSGDDPAALADAIGKLSGVTHVEPNRITGNVRIDFEPSLTSVPDLLESLPAVWPTASPSIDVLAVNGQPGDYQYVTGPWRVVYQGLGWASVGMAVVGAILPGIPTAPFVILAGYFFVRSSREAHEWLRESRVFGPILRDWEAHQAIRRPLRNLAVGLIAGGMVLTLFLDLGLPLTASIVAMQIIGLAIVLRLKVIDAEEVVAENALTTA